MNCDCDNITQVSEYHNVTHKVTKIHTYIHAHTPKRLSSLRDYNLLFSRCPHNVSAYHVKPCKLQLFLFMQRIAYTRYFSAVMFMTFFPAHARHRIVN